MKSTTLDLYEKTVLDSLKKGEWESSINLSKEKRQLQNNAKFTQSKLQNISIDVKEEDLSNLKKMSLEIGIPYQNIISALIHNYSTGRIKLNL